MCSMKFACMHLAGTFIQSELNCIQGTQCFQFPGNETHDLDVMLYCLSYITALSVLVCFVVAN